MKRSVLLHIDGQWVAGNSGRTIPIVNPASGQAIGEVACADIVDLDRALMAADKGFRIWKKSPALDRYRVMRKAADILRSRLDEVATAITVEQGKPLAQARLEVGMGIEVIDWCAEEARRTYGRVIPSRFPDVLQLAMKEPVGPVAAFSPWNFPINQSVRKISPALAAGCSIIVKGPDETPTACALLVQAFMDAGVPSGVLNLVFGPPAEISQHLITHPIIRKISFTGSTTVGKHLAMLAGAHMKRATMELGGHAPALIFDDADVDVAISILSQQKIRNAGQVCTSPTRFIVQEGVLDRFVNGFTSATRNLRIGDGLDPDTQLGPLVRERRVHAMQCLVENALEKGAEIQSGGGRLDGSGFFFDMTVLTGVPLDARIMNEEPFGPVAPIVSFKTLDDAIAEANRLPYGLAAYAYTGSARTVATLGAAVEAGVVSINHNGVAIPETPFGGIKDSGYGSEGGIEAVEAYLNTKFITQKTA
jgi:succinate-semialdehyde dehydrogenase/glutarate-semialdehyde dehydrogenase